MTPVITQLRDMMPIRPLSQAEAMRMAELQATRLLDLSGVEGGPVPEGVVTSLPRIQVERLYPSPVSGAAQWSRGRWLILINGTEPPGRQRFSLVHEFKHVLDNPFVSVIYPPHMGMSSHDRAEQVCDYFAGCVLMPRRWVKRAWVDGIQDVRQMAKLFDVSPTAMQVRLLQIGLVEPVARCQVAA